MRYFMILNIAFVKSQSVWLWFRLPNFCMPFSVCLCACMPVWVDVCACACQVFIVGECVMFFYCTLPEINCSPFTVGREVVLSFSQRRRRGRRPRELGREVQKEKEWPSADSRPLYRSKVFSQWQLTGGKTNQKFWDTEQGRRKKKRQSCLQTTVFPRYVMAAHSQSEWV